MKKILFVHNNFPAQFVHLAWTLARYPDVKLAAIGTNTARNMSGVKLMRYIVSDSDVSAAHPFARRFDLECRRAEQVLYAASTLRASGFEPDIVIGHPGWGETLPLRSVFPRSQIFTYCEFFYRNEGQDVGFDPEFPQTGIDGRVNIHLKNAATLLALNECDAAVSPTQWQKSTYPQEYQNKIHVVHDGIDTEIIRPDDDASFELPDGTVLTRHDEILTFATRSHEPLRGYHIFMRALPRILAERPNAQVMVIGGSGSSYGFGAPQGKTWRSIFFDEVAAAVDTSRIHFIGDLPHRNYLRALQVSRAHIYFTYPFVLSWSLLEAMAAGCLVIGSDTAPVREVIDRNTGILVPFFDVNTLAERAIEVLARPRRFRALRAHARERIVERFDLKTVCLPRWLELLGIEQADGELSSSRIEIQPEEVE